MQTNEELLYDPVADDQDEAWVIQKVQQAAPGKSKDARTDAILTCPLCFSPVCYNCQRHEKYQNQYRAMFVTNCQVKKTERYRYAEDDQEAYYIVTCKTCETHVAMMDEDEIFHFFNVIAT
ncbi:E2F-associated phospho protein-domain-containing protein [Syncephalastrum racemosum]|uniref:E2F-associated phospho protein-domain-containing protein n=1 Tax=Syncephalastrum racemosum TaxID=13706 RepID=A0A1X2HU31_SYNRA|nr:E2F-associated phospho protein-domain-containing protein [Syncephalastrum racemosum]